MKKGFLALVVCCSLLASSMHGMEDSPEVEAQQNSGNESDISTGSVVINNTPQNEGEGPKLNVALSNQAIEEEKNTSEEAIHDSDSDAPQSQPNLADITLLISDDEPDSASGAENHGKENAAGAEVVPMDETREGGTSGHSAEEKFSSEIETNGPAVLEVHSAGSDSESKRVEEISLQNTDSESEEKFNASDEDVSRLRADESGNSDLKSFFNFKTVQPWLFGIGGLAGVGAAGWKLYSYLFLVSERKQNAAILTELKERVLDEEMFPEEVVAFFDEHAHRLTLLNNEDKEKLRDQLVHGSVKGEPIKRLLESLDDRVALKREHLTLWERTCDGALRDWQKLKGWFDTSRLR